MTWLITLVVVVTLSAISALHPAWGLGSAFPCKDRETRTAVGQIGGKGMPPNLSPLLVAALWPQMMQGWVLPFMPVSLLATGALLLTAVFLGRGAAGLTPWFHRHLAEEPSATLNRKYYSPLCAALAYAM